MARLCAYFISFLLLTLILKPDYYIVEARQVRLGRQRAGSRMLSSEEKPARSVPSPGNGHRFENMKYPPSWPSPGGGHQFESSKKAPLSIQNSGPSPGEGHKHVPTRPVDENKA